MVRIHGHKPKNWRCFPNEKTHSPLKNFRWPAVLPAHGRHGPRDAHAMQALTGSALIRFWTCEASTRLDGASCTGAVDGQQPTNKQVQQPTAKHQAPSKHNKPTNSKEVQQTAKPTQETNRGAANRFKCLQPGHGLLSHPGLPRKQPVAN